MEVTEDIVKRHILLIQTEQCIITKLILHTVFFKSKVKHKNQYF